MNIRKTLSPAWLFLSLLIFSQTAQAAAGERWTQVRSENFNLIGNADEARIRAVAAKLEQFREALGQVLNRMNFDSPVPTTVVVFKSAADYKPYKPLKSTGEIYDAVVGYFQSGRDGNYITLAADADSDKTFNIIFHEYTHFLLRNNIGESKIPSWLNEGTANYYETFTVENDRKITLGGAQPKFPALLRQNNLIPFETFFSVDNNSLHEQGIDGAGLFYAQAWALVHYLMHGGSGARKPELENFLDLITAGKNQKDAFAEAFKIAPAEMEIELKKYIDQNVFPLRGVELKNKLTVDFEMKSAPLPEAEVEAYLGDLLFRANRPAEAETHLRDSLKLDAGSVRALVVLGLIKMRGQNFAEAEKYLEKAVASGSNDYLAHYNYAYVLSSQGMSEYGFVSEYSPPLADKMRKALLRAIELNPGFAESYSLYAFVNMVRNENIDEAINYIEKALKIAPGNQWYLLRLAELYLRKEEFSDARAIAARVARTAADNELKVYSENALRIINTTEEAYLSIKNYNKRHGIKNYLDRVLTDEEFAVLRDRRILESINEALYKPSKDEKRVLGYLTRVVCEPENMFYLVRADNKTIKLRSSSFYSVKLTAYAPGMANWTVGCGKVTKESLAVINYRPAKDAEARAAGEIISIEFVPENFKFLN